MSVRSVLVTVVGTISIWIGLVALPIYANSELPFNWVRNLNSTAWGYTEVEDPSESELDNLVERFELRRGDCNRNERQDDCNSYQERMELVEPDRPVIPLSGEVWYRWKMYFPENYKLIYPAKTYHIRFFEKGEQPVWSFEVGSTGVFWLGSYASDEPTYYPLIDEDELLSHWHEFSIHARWEPDSGWFKVWINNVKKVNYEGPTCRDCRVQLGYGIMRSDLEKYHQSYPAAQLPTQVVYYTQPQRSTSGIGYPGYVPPQKIKTFTMDESPKTLKPVLIIETKSPNTSVIPQFGEGKGDAEIPNQD